jgi:hypothetical protein
VLFRKRLYLVLFLCVHFEASVPHFPHLSLGLVIFAALTEGWVTGAKCGLGLGILLAMLGVESGSLVALIYFIVGASCGLLKGKVFAQSMITPWILTGLMHLLILAILYVAQGNPWDRGILFWRSLTQSSVALTILFSPILFYLSNKFLRPTERLSWTSTLS